MAVAALRCWLEGDKDGVRSLLHAADDLERTDRAVRSLGLFALGYTGADELEPFTYRTTSVDALLTHVDEAGTAFVQAFPDAGRQLLRELATSLALEAW